MDKDFQLELQKMDERLTDLESKIDTIDGKLNQVVEALVGNPLMGSGNGLAAKIDKLEKEIEELREFKKKIIYTVSTIVSIGLVLQFIIKTYVGLNK